MEHSTLYRRFPVDTGRYGAEEYNVQLLWWEVGDCGRSVDALRWLCMERGNITGSCNSFQSSLLRS
jgi:hypothetical protein